MPRVAKKRTTAAKATPRPRKDTPGHAAKLNAKECAAAIEKFRADHPKRAKWTPADDRAWNELNARMRELRAFEDETRRRETPPADDD